MIGRFADLAEFVLRRPPGLGSVRIVAVDGPTGAGKTTFAERLTAALRAAGASVVQVHTDDLLDGWHDMVTFWPRLEESVLTPLRRGIPGAYRPFDWLAGRFGSRVVPVPVPDVLLIDGVTSARAAIRDRLALSVFVVAPAPLRLRRTLHRDGQALEPHLRVWMDAEREHFTEDGTEARADLVVAGAPGVEHDPRTEYVRLGGAGGTARTRGAGHAETPRVNRAGKDGIAWSPMTSTLSEGQLRAAVERELPGVRADLERLVRIPGIAFDGFDFSHLARSAQATADLLRGAGLPDVKVVRIGDGHPAVIGRRPAPPGAPTVMLYAHHDVQPIGDRSQWLSEPFEPTERDGRLYGRGAADDKAGIMAHVAALRALGDGVPVGVVVFVEGEEEYGSFSLEALLQEYREEVASDVIVIADSSNWDVGEPALTTALRGIVNCYVEVRTLDRAVHSGMFGGAVPDAITTLCRLLATLHDDVGDAAVEGLLRGSTAALDYPVDRLRNDAGILDGVELIGTGRIVERMWSKPAISVIGIDAPPVDEAPNALVPSARAKLSMRIAPGDKAAEAFEALKAHLERHAPWGARVSVTLEHLGEPCVIDSSGRAYDLARAAFAAAWDGTAPVEIGVGGSIPFIATFQKIFPDAAILVTGVEDPDGRAHGPNESLHLAEFARVCLAETLLLARLGSLAESR